MKISDFETLRQIIVLFKTLGSWQFGLLKDKLQQAWSVVSHGFVGPGVYKVGQKNPTVWKEEHWRFVNSFVVDIVSPHVCCHCACWSSWNDDLAGVEQVEVFIQIVKMGSSIVLSSEVKLLALVLDGTWLKPLMQTSIAVWDKHSSPFVEVWVHLRVWIEEYVFTQRLFIRVVPWAPQISCGSLETVVEHSVHAIATTESSSLKED